jgi:GTPase SAR1 family protein
VARLVLSRAADVSTLLACRKNVDTSSRRFVLCVVCIDVKIICLGDSMVGKSKLVERFLMDDYEPQVDSTWVMPSLPSVATPSLPCVDTCSHALTDVCRHL